MYVNHELACGADWACQDACYTVKGITTCAKECPDTTCHAVKAYLPGGDTLVLDYGSLPVQVSITVARGGQNLPSGTRPGGTPKQCCDACKVSTNQCLSVSLQLLVFEDFRELNDLSLQRPVEAELLTPTLIHTV